MNQSERNLRWSLFVALAGGWLWPAASVIAGPPVQPLVLAEEEVYRYEPANNGAGPMWCSGSTCLVRIGDDLFASGLETLPDAKPLNNCRWVVFKRDAVGWKQVKVDPSGRTREPSPLAALPDGRVFLSANPTLVPPGREGGGPARPELWEFSASDSNAVPKQLLPVWSGSPKFTEHSYRSFAADGPNRELILFQNIDYTHAEWAFLDRDGNWAAKGKLQWPWGAEYDKPQPIRICYPNVVLKDRTVHFCGVSDIVEPYGQWRAFKKELTGRDWDYDFRRLFYAWTPDIRKAQTQPWIWIEIASRDKTSGWISPCDLWIGPDNSARILWTERALDERLREKFFPNEKQSHALNFAVVREGRVTLRKSFHVAEEGKSREIISAARFQITPEGRLFVICYVSGADAAGRSLSENRIFEVHPDGERSEMTVVPLKHPMNSFFTATVRAGSAPSKIIDLLGNRAGSGNAISYAQVQLK